MFSANWNAPKNGKVSCISNLIVAQESSSEAGVEKVATLLTIKPAPIEPAHACNAVNGEPFLLVRNLSLLVKIGFLFPPQADDVISFMSVLK